jgi:hypothetical protein
MHVCLCHVQHVHLIAATSCMVMWVDGQCGVLCMV